MHFTLCDDCPLMLLRCSAVLKLADDRMALVSGISLDPEAAIGVTKKLPPKWVDGVDEVRTVNGDSIESRLTSVKETHTHTHTLSTHV